MKTLYQANDIEEAIIQTLVQAWPPSSGDWSDWQKIRIRIQTARNIVRNVDKKKAYEPDNNLVRVMDDLNMLYGIAVVRGIEFEQTRSPQEAA